MEISRLTVLYLFLTLFRHWAELYLLNVVYSGYIGFASVDNRRPAKVLMITFNVIYVTRGQSNLTKSASRGAHSPVRGHPRVSKVVPLNSWGRVSY